MYRAVEAKREAGELETAVPKPGARTAAQARADADVRLVCVCVRVVPRSLKRSPLTFGRMRTLPLS